MLVMNIFLMKFLILFLENFTKNKFLQGFPIGERHFPIGHCFLTKIFWDWKIKRQNFGICKQTNNPNIFQIQQRHFHLKSIQNSNEYKIPGFVKMWATNILLMNFLILVLEMFTKRKKMQGFPIGKRVFSQRPLLDLKNIKINIYIKYAKWHVANIFANGIAFLYWFIV